MQFKRILNGVLLLCLVLSVTACASRGIAPVQGVLCQHPKIDVSTNGGLSAAVQSYQEALAGCNALNSTYEINSNIEGI